MIRRVVREVDPDTETIYRRADEGRDQELAEYDEDLYEDPADRGKLGNYYGDR